MGRNCNTILVVENYRGKVVVAKQTRYTFPKWKAQVTMVISTNKKVASLTMISNVSFPSSASDMKLCSWIFFVYYGMFKYVFRCILLFIMLEKKKGIVESDLVLVENHLNSIQQMQIHIGRFTNLRPFWVHGMGMIFTKIIDIMFQKKILQVNKNSVMPHLMIQTSRMPTRNVGLQSQNNPKSIRVHNLTNVFVPKGKLKNKKALSH